MSPLWYVRGGGSTPVADRLLGHNYLVVSSSQFTIMDGTSASTPALAGLVGRLNQRLINLGGNGAVGQLTPALYALAQANQAAFLP
jgi:hypothetical protein